MKPINFEAANTQIGGIPVNQTHGMILSRWSATWRERLSILVHGTIWLAVKGNTMPPTLISGDQTFRIENP